MQPVDENPKQKFRPLEFLGLRQFPHNTAVLMATEPLWSIPGNWYLTYFAFFMASLGLSAVQIGAVTSIGLVSKILLSALGGHITDRFGRKRTLLFFDIICWIIPSAIWATATCFWQFAIGVILNNFVWIVTPAWLCLLYEEAPVELRTKISAVNQGIFILGGFTLPFAGWIIKTHGTIPGIRWLLWGFCVCMIFAVVIRSFLVRESSIGVAMREESQKVTGHESFKKNLKTLKFILHTKSLRALLLLGILFNFALNFANTYNALFITKTRGLALSADLLAIFPLLTSSLSLLLTFVIVPHIKVGKEGKALWIAMVFNILGYLVFAFGPAGWALTAWIGIATLAVAGGLYIPVREGTWQNQIPDEERARVIALAASLECIFLLPAAPLGGWLFQMSPRSIYLVGAGIIVASLFLIAQTKSLNTHKPIAEQAEPIIGEAL